MPEYGGAYGAKDGPFFKVMLYEETNMRPVKRFGVNKKASAGKFRSNVGRTHGVNMRQAPMRGGWRL